MRADNDRVVSAEIPGVGTLLARAANPHEPSELTWVAVCLLQPSAEQSNRHWSKWLKVRGLWPIASVALTLLQTDRLHVRRELRARALGDWIARHPTRAMTQIGTVATGLVDQISLEGGPHVG